MTNLDDLIAEAKFYAATRERDAALARTAELEAKHPEGWSTEDRQAAHEEATLRWGDRTGNPDTADYTAGAVTGFILGAEWQKARETFISYKAIADEAEARITELEAELAKSDAAFQSLKVSTGPTDARLTRAEARIAKAAELHYRDTPNIGGDWCPEDHHKWPCPTAVALGLNEGENDGKSDA